MIDEGDYKQTELTFNLCTQQDYLDSFADFDLFKQGALDPTLTLCINGLSEIGLKGTPLQINASYIRISME